jgi:hypothetical protein
MEIDGWSPQTAFDCAFIPVGESRAIVARKVKTRQQGFQRTESESLGENKQLLA